jgi:hypothetical protein
MRFANVISRGRIEILDGIRSADGPRTLQPIARQIVRSSEKQGPLDVRFEMRLSDDLAERLKVQAARLGLSDGAYIRLALVRQLEQDEASRKDQD